MTVKGLAIDGIRIDSDEHKGLTVVATRLFQPNEVVVFGGAGQVVPERTNHSFQTGLHTHVDMAPPACYLNHSCDPNTGVVDNDQGGFDFVALREIATGEEITWDYETSEFISIAVPHCRCGAANCRGVIRGFLYRCSDSAWQPTHLAGYLRRGTDAKARTGAVHTASTNGR